MATAAVLQKLEARALAAEKLIAMLRLQIKEAKVTAFFILAAFLFVNLLLQISLFACAVEQLTPMSTSQVSNHHILFPNGLRVTTSFDTNICTHLSSSFGHVIKKHVFMNIVYALHMCIQKFSTYFL